LRRRIAPTPRMRWPLRSVAPTVRCRELLDRRS
jgi:hypothetical protein